MKKKYPEAMPLPETEGERENEAFAEIIRLCEQDDWRMASDRLEYLVARAGKPEWEWLVEALRSSIANGLGDTKQAAVHLWNMLQAGRNSIPLNQHCSRYSDFLFLQHYLL